MQLYPGHKAGVMQPRQAAGGKGLTLYSMMQTNMLRGILKKLMMVERLSSGTYWLRIFIMLGQKMPTHASKTQKASSWILLSKVIPVSTPAVRQATTTLQLKWKSLVNEPQHCSLL